MWTQPDRGVIIYLPDALEVMIGETTAQDLLLDLGPPLRKFWKEDDRVERMWGGASSADDEKGACESKRSVYTLLTASIRLLELFPIWHRLFDPPFWGHLQNHPPL